MTPFDHLRAQFTQQRKEFDRLARKVRRRQKKKAVHRLRVATRRLRAMLWILERSSVDLRFGKLRKLLKKEGKSLGALREMDVALDDAANYQIPRKKLKKVRRKEKLKVHSSLRKKDRGKIIKRLSDADRRLQLVGEQDLEPGIQELQRRLDPWFRKTPRTNREFHEFRIAMKKVRYGLESIGRPVTSLVDLQDQLGKIHDLEVLQSFTGQRPKIHRDEIGKKRAASRAMGPALRYATRQLRIGSKK